MDINILNNYSRFRDEKISISPQVQQSTLTELPPTYTCSDRSVATSFYNNAPPILRVAD